MTFLRLIRVKQWIKNLFVFLPLIFGGRLLSSQGVTESIAAFACFCLGSSAIYVLNDIIDRKADRLHPVKCHRPVASGLMSARSAAYISAFLAAASIAGSIFLFPGNAAVCVITVTYLLLNVLYSCALKHMAIIDVMVIALGFVLRVFAGGEACGIPVSPWLTIMVFMLTLFIAFGKRRDDLLRMKEERHVTRKSVACYTLGFVDQAMTLLASALIVAYIIYSLQPEVESRFNSHYVYLTTIFVIAGVLRYMQIAIVKKNSGQPTEMVYNDPFLLTCIILWIATFIFIIYT